MNETVAASATQVRSSRFHWRAYLSAFAERLGLPPALVRYALLLFVVSRLGFIAITIAGHTLIHHPLGDHPQTFLEIWVRYDAIHYAAIARDGYQGSPFYRAAFFPLQPLATAIIAPLIGGSTEIAGMIVANIAFFFALLGLGALALTLGDAAAQPTASADDTRIDTARRAMLYLTIYPLSFFLFAGYAESMFIALAAWSLVALRRRAWWQAGVLGLLAAMTRQMGLFLMLPFAYDYAAHMGWSLRKVRLSAAWILLIPGGLLIFMGWLWLTLGDPLAFQHAENHWQHVFSLPWATLSWAWRLFLKEHAPLFIYKDTADLASVVIFAALIVAGMFGARRLRPGDTAYCIAVWLLVLCYPARGWPVQSDARYMLAAFPCFLTLAVLARRRWVHALIAIGSTLILIFLTQYFVRGALFI